MDPKERIPALVLTFGFPAGRLCTVTTSLPKLPLRTRGRLLKAYADTAADTQADSILIGGACADQILFVENQISKLDIELEIYTNAHLCLLAHSSERTQTKCTAFDIQGAFTLQAIVSSAEQPASQEREGDREE